MPSSPVKKSSITPSPLPAPEAPPIGHPELLGFLKGKDNPFDVFIAARKPDADFPRYHVPGVYEELLAPLRGVVERFRLARIERESDLPRSGVVLVEGARGIGKTHMVHTLQHGETAPSVVVTPSIYEPHRPFIEYLLHQLVRYFQNETDGTAPGTLELLADALARQLVVQALYGMTEIDWLARNVDGRGSFWRLFWGWGARRVADRKRMLVLGLQQREIPSIGQVCEQHEQDPAELRMIALEQIGREETALTIAGQIRRGLYTRLVQTAFGEPREALYEFLLDGYTQVEARIQPSRESLVDELFQGLLELFLLARMPVVFAFDALEALFGDPAEPRLFQPFFNGLANVLDSHRGIPFVVFAERGHWHQILPNLSNYSRHRLEQGVIRVPNHGSVSVLRFPEMSAKRLDAIVTARMRPLHEEFHESSETSVPPTFPFQEGDLVAIAGKDKGAAPTLRQALQSLRDRYDQLVSGIPGMTEGGREPEEPPATPPPTEAMEACWQRELRTAKKKLQGSLTGLADDLHAGILQWLGYLCTEGSGAGENKPAKAENMTFGTHATYGQMTRFRWTGPAGSPLVGIGLLLGERTGMPRDLEAKLKMMAGAQALAEVLVVIWPKGADIPPPVYESFPPATRAVWDHYAEGRMAKLAQRVQLRAVNPEDLTPWLALPPWLSAIRTEIDGPSADVIAHFVVDKTSSLLPLVAPGS
jgi:hypothetical protein